ncbi:MAG: bifunctional riboflavin kinase/FAD synthetase [Pseudomonadota bacterium]
MQLIRTLNPDRAPAGSTALAIGNFDGLHRGHQALIQDALDKAASASLQPALMCFEPLPVTLLRPQDPVPRLHAVRDRVIESTALGVERLYMLRFNRAFAALSPEAFVKQVVLGVARAQHVVVGSDFRFGVRAAGDVDQLREFGDRYGFSVSVVAPVLHGDERISSSRLRTALAVGKMDCVRDLLGRPYCLHGRVLRGQQLGRELGFPTVNLRPPLPPAAHGIFAAKVSGSGLTDHPAVLSLGMRPTVAGDSWLLEAHLFDYDGDLYGRHLRVEFVERLRGEEKFDSLDAMRIQMDDDARQARRILGIEARR